MSRPRDDRSLSGRLGAALKRDGEAFVELDDFEKPGDRSPEQSKLRARATLHMAAKREGLRVRTQTLHRRVVGKVTSR